MSIMDATRLAAAEARLAEWIAYADKLETALRIVASLTNDGLKRMQADDALHIVKPALHNGIETTDE